jgi:hypothetical protein
MKSNKRAQANLQSALDSQFQQGRRRFAKLQERGEPYLFDGWRTDYTGALCLYYTFSGHTKRVPLHELVAALQKLLEKGELSRADFRRACPVAESAGPCGFAVTGRSFERLGIARYEGQGMGFLLKNRERAEELLNVQA